MKRLVLTVVVSWSLVSGGSALALPFNDDMVNNQLKAGQVTRPKPAGVVARGVLDGDFPLHLEKKEDTANFVNPKRGDKDSIAMGKRLYAINCSPCHGDLEKTPYVPGVAGGLMGAPDLTAPMYKERTEGSIYGTIHFGGMALMPAYGWKLSPSEHWDIVSYVKAIQASR
jgi:mono/diheme cytochrome c family protein